MKRARKRNRERVIRKARITDAAGIATLSTQLGYPSSPSKIAARLSFLLDDPGHAVFISEARGGKVAGWVHVFARNLVESDPHAEIGGMVVEEHFRGRGIGKSLMEQAEHWAQKKKLRSVYLRSNVLREGAHAFYLRLGYTKIKTQHAFLKSFRKGEAARPG